MKTNIKRTVLLGRPLLLWALPLLMSFALISCSKEGGGTSEESGFYLRLETRADDNASAQEQKISKLRLLIYNDKDMLEFNYLFEGSELKTSSSGYVIEKALEDIEHGHKTICLVANEPSSISATLADDSQINTLNRLQSSDLKLTDSPSIISAGNLPFTCLERKYISPGDNDIALKLERVVGRVDLKICKDETLKDVNVVLKSTQVLQAAPESRLINVNPLSWSESQLISLPVKTNFPNEGKIPASVGEFLTVNNIAYLYEYQPVTKEAATLLKVVVKIGSVEVEGTYPLICGKDGNNDIYGVRRNTVSRLSLTAFKDRLELNPDDDNWNEEDIDIEFGEDDGSGGSIGGEVDPGGDWES